MPFYSVNTVTLIGVVRQHRNHGVNSHELLVETQRAGRRADGEWDVVYDKHTVICQDSDAEYARLSCPKDSLVCVEGAIGYIENEDTRRDEAIIYVNRITCLSNEVL